MIDGVVRPPSAFSMTLAVPFSRTETQELVVPRSIPMIFPIFNSPESGGACVPARAAAAQMCLVKQMGSARWISSLFVDRRRRVGRCLADHDHRRAQQATVEQVALLEHLEHAARLQRGA